MLRKALILAVLASAAARAGGDSTTLYDSSPYVRDGGHQDNSIYEAFSLFARAEGNDWLKDIRIVARGWGRLTLGTSFDDHTTAGDVDSLFLEGRVLKRHLLLRVGRQLMTGGAMRATQVDGITADGVVAYGLGVQAWAGVPVQPRFAQAGGDFITGARGFWRHSFDSEEGVSYVYALRKGYLARSDLGVDGSWTPIRAGTVSGRAQWVHAAERLAEARLQGLWQINKQVQVVGDVSRIAPDLFIDRSSIFAVFSAELRNQAGARGCFPPLPPLLPAARCHCRRGEG